MPQDKLRLPVNRADPRFAPEPAKCADRCRDGKDRALRRAIRPESQRSAIFQGKQLSRDVAGCKNLWTCQFPLGRPGLDRPQPLDI